MALVIEDRVQEVTTTTGTGNIIVAGAVTAYRTFSSVCATGDTCYCMVVAVNNNGAPTGEWESGLYTYSAANTLTRTAVHANSAGTSASLSFSAGTKRVFIDITAAQVQTFIADSNPANATPFGQDAALFTGLIFQEEFNGTALDSSRWQNTIPGSTSDATINYEVANGALYIWPASNFVMRHISTATKFYFTPGCYVEVKAKLPAGKGVAANMWLFINDTPTQQNIDIAKTHSAGNVTNNASTAWPGYANANYHPINFQTKSTPDTTNGPTSNYKASDYITVPDLSLAPHIYAVKWETDGITFLCDGVPVGAKIATTAMTQRMYMNLTLGYDSGADAPDAANTPTGKGNSFVIDYVRGWQLA